MYHSILLNIILYCYYFGKVATEDPEGLKKKPKMFLRKTLNIVALILCI